MPPTAPQPRPSVRSGPSSHHSRSSERSVVRECAEGVATMCQQYIPCVSARTGCSFCTHALSGYGSYLMAYFCGKRNCEATLDTGVAGYHTARERQMYGILVFTVVRDDGQRSGSLSAVGTPLPTPPYIAIRRAPFPTLPITATSVKERCRPGLVAQATAYAATEATARAARASGRCRTTASTTTVSQSCKQSLGTPRRDRRTA